MPGVSLWCPPRHRHCQIWVALAADLGTEMATSDPYAVLGVREDATSGEIRAAYIRRVWLCHPDRSTSDADRARRTRATVALNRSYASLRTTPLRNEAIVPTQRPQKSGDVDAPLHGLFGKVIHILGDDPGAHRAVRSLRTIVSRLPPIRVSLRTLCAVVGSIVAGIAASTVTGEIPMTVGCLVGGTLWMRWSHDHDIG